MSSILKALEKVERERSARREGLSPVLSSAGKRRSRWALPTGIAIGAAAACLITFAAMGGFSRQSTSAKVAAPAPAPAAPVVQKVAASTGPAPAALAPAPAPVAVQPPAVAASAAPVVDRSEPAPPAAVAPKVRPVVAAKPPVAKAAAVTAPPKGNEQVARKVAAAAQPKVAVVQKAAPAKPASASAVQKTALQASVAPAAAAVSVAPAPAAPAPSLPDMKVTGIALQTNGDTSFAIVNGRPVAKGGTVDGVRVEEILADRVRFSGSGKHFEVRVEEEKP